MKKKLTFTTITIILWSVILGVLLPKESMAQTKKISISGTVYSGEDQSPLIGVTVWLKNTSEGVLTDIDGRYSISLDNKPENVLVFSFTGLQSQEIPISKAVNGIIDVSLIVDPSQIEEVVVVGYGYQKKESVVGSISTLDVNKLVVPSANISNVLAGQLSGVVAMNRSGEPGRASTADFYIRGVASFTGNNKPLVLVDGVERELDLVDVEDIEGFSILKDASASAVYGVRGANGVILITTKKGKIGKPIINARGEMSITSPTQMPKFTNSPQWAELYNEMIGFEYYTEEDVERYRSGYDPDLYPNVNWMKALYKDMAQSQRVNVNVSGGGDISNYYVAGSIYNEGSIFREAGDSYDYRTSINYSRYSFRANMDFKITSSTVLNVNLANIYEKEFAPGASKTEIWSNAFNVAPNAFPVIYSDGTLSAPSIQGGTNPWNLLAHSGYTEKWQNSAQSLVGLTQDLENVISGLKANVKFSWDAVNANTQQRKKTPPQYHATGRDQDGNLIFGNGAPIYDGDNKLGFSESGAGSNITYFESNFTYNKLFGKHRIGGLLLYNSTIKYIKFSGSSETSLPFKNQGVAGRVTYAFNDKYFAEFNAGYNGSENFAQGHRFGFFPAYAIGWMISNEGFWDGLKKAIPNMKLRASYGDVGNDNIGGGRWIYRSTINNAPNTWHYGETANQGGTGLIEGNIENLNVSWERATKLNAGIDATFFGNLRLMVDYFREIRDGVFTTRGTIPDFVGIYTKPKVNVGKSLNYGIDGTMEYEKMVGEVYINFRGSFTYNRNKLLENDQVDQAYKYRNQKGKPFGSAGSHPFGYVALGLFQSQEEIDNSPEQRLGTYRVGDVRYQDINGDGTIDVNDQIAIGYTNLPEIMYGFGTSVSWKGFSISAFFQGVAHTSFFIGGSAMRPFLTGNVNQSSINDDIYHHSWKTTNSVEQNLAAIYPRLSTAGGAGSANNNVNSTLNQRDGRFLRLKNFEVGYSLPKKWIDKTFIEDFRLYISGVNLFTFSKFNLWDAELGSADGSVYPPNRAITFGFTGKF